MADPFVRGLEAVGVVDFASGEETSGAATQAAFSELGSDAIYKYCFAAGTLVLMADGSTKAIEQIETGDRVLSVPEQEVTRSPVSRAVVEVYHNEPSQLLNLHIGDDVIRTTAGHPFYVQDRGWTRAEHLESGDRLYTHTGQSLALTDVQQTEATQPVFNLQVDDHHTYFVALSSGGSVLVHNQSNEELREKVMTPYIAELESRLDSTSSKTEKLFLINPADKHFFLWVTLRTMVYDAWAMEATGISEGYEGGREILASEASNPDRTGFEQVMFSAAHDATYAMEGLSHGTMRVGQAGTYAAALIPAAGTAPGQALLGYAQPYLPHLAATGTGLQAGSIGVRLSAEEGRSALTPGDFVDLAMSAYGTYSLSQWANAPMGQAMNGNQRAITVRLISPQERLNSPVHVERFTRSPARNTVTGETVSTNMGKVAHRVQAGIRRETGNFDLVQQAIRDKNGNIVFVPKRVDLKTGVAHEGTKTQKAIPDAVSFRRGLIIDDKPLGRPLAKDRQEIIRFINAYRTREGQLPDVIAIQRYDPNTGVPVQTDLHSPSKFLPGS